MLEKKLAYDPNIKLPSCVKGKRACPPEDCGGVWGYQELLEVIQDPEHPEYEEMLEWLGEELDPEEFNPTFRTSICTMPCNTLTPCLQNIPQVIKQRN